MKKYSVFMVILILAIIGSGCTNRENEAKLEKIEDVSVFETGYDIEKVFPDPIFAQIVEGKIIPKEIRHGIGGEGGYIQYPSKDPEVINKYIEALKEFKIKEVIEDENEFKYTADAVNDYIFYLEDGRELLVSIDLNAYVIDMEKGIQYVLEFNKKLSDLNKEYYIDITQEETLREYSFSSVADFNNLSDDDVIYLVTHDYKTSHFIDDFKTDSFSDFCIPLEDYERYEPVLLNPGGERQDYDVNKKISDKDFKKLTEDYMNAFRENLDSMKIDYLGETEHYMEYRYSSSQQFGSGRICFYRNLYMISEKIDGNFYAGPVYLGELTVDSVLSEEDFYLSIFDNECLLWRGVEESATSIIYTYYNPNLKDTGDYDEYGQNQKAEILRSKIIYDKETHRMTQETEVVRSVNIPGTTLYIPDAV